MGQNEPPAADSDFESYEKEVRNGTFFKSYRWNLVFYRKHARKVRILFRTCGPITILLSLALPIVAAFGEPFTRHELLLSVMAAAIALLSSLNAFFGWDQSWKGFINARLELERLHDRWELDIAEAKTDPSPANRLKLARDATDKFEKQAREVIKSETEGYFARVKFPEETNLRPHETSSLNFREYLFHALR